MTQLFANIDWYRFLGRAPLPQPSPESISNLRIAPVLITGAGGSIGSALAHNLAGEGCRTVLLDSAESNLYEIQQEFSNSHSTAPAFYLGSVADRQLLNEIFAVHKPRFVFHAAAFKHVPLMEEQPLAAITNNVFGTETLVSAACAAGARVVLLSTDKAVAPASIMGATKRIAERITLVCGCGTVLRLGNVLASRGSVAEIFAKEIAEGRPLTVTDPAARRYFLTIDEAVNLLISTSTQLGPALSVPVLDHPHFIAELAEFMAQTLAPGQKIGIEFTRLRPGDKETEQLWSADELPQMQPGAALVRIQSPLPSANQLKLKLESLRNAVFERDVAAALATVRTLVPDFTPGNTLLSSHPSQVSVPNE